MPFGEDEYFQIMERTTLSGNRRLARAVQTVMWETAELNAGLTRAQLLRRLTIRVLAARAHLSFDALDDLQQSEVLQSLKKDSMHT
jgi:hypothetical protein